MDAWVGPLLRAGLVLGVLKHRSDSSKGGKRQIREAHLKLLQRDLFKVPPGRGAASCGGRRCSWIRADLIISAPRCHSGHHYGIKASIFPAPDLQSHKRKARASFSIRFSHFDLKRQPWRPDQLRPAQIPTRASH